MFIYVPQFLLSLQSVPLCTSCFTLIVSHQLALPCLICVFCACRAFQLILLCPVSLCVFMSVYPSVTCRNLLIHGCVFPYVSLHVFNLYFPSVVFLKFSLPAIKLLFKFTFSPPWSLHLGPILPAHSCFVTSQTREVYWGPHSETMSGNRAKKHGSWGTEPFLKLKGVVEGDRVHSLGELSIDVSIELLPTDRASNEINGDVGPRLSWDHQWTHVASRQRVSWFTLVTDLKSHNSTAANESEWFISSQEDFLGEISKRMAVLSFLFLAYSSLCNFGKLVNNQIFSQSV